jgi:hypothetical protein
MISLFNWDRKLFDFKFKETVLGGNGSTTKNNILKENGFGGLDEISKGVAKYLRPTLETLQYIM